MSTTTVSDTAIEVCEGRFIDLLNPSTADIYIGDIARSLSRECRYSGFCTQFYSVAQHCLLVRDILFEDGASEEEQRAGLWHDAAEAFLGDVSAPLKRAMRTVCSVRSPYDVLEQRMQEAIRLKFRIAWNWQIASNVREADQLALRIERAQLMASQGRDWNGSGVPLLDWPKLKPLAPVDAYAAWLQAAR